MSKANKNREKYLNDIFLQRRSKIEDYEDDDIDLEDAVSMERTRKVMSKS
jgi:hypothetical protein